MNGTFSGTTAGGGNLDGETPAAPLVEFNGELYGTTAYGGSNPSLSNGLSNGAVFEVSLDGKEHVLHRFVDTNDGATPSAALTVFNGALYGTTYFGGDATPSSHGNGTIFKVTTGGKESVLYDFTGGANGGNLAAGLLLLNGRFFGTTSEAGLSQPSGDGTVFAFAP